MQEDAYPIIDGSAEGLHLVVLELNLSLETLDCLHVLFSVELLLADNTVKVLEGVLGITTGLGLSSTVVLELSDLDLELADLVLGSSTGSSLNLLNPGVQLEDVVAQLGVVALKKGTSVSLTGQVRLELGAHISMTLDLVLSRESLGLELFEGFTESSNINLSLAFLGCDGRDLSLEIGDMGSHLALLALGSSSGTVSSVKVTLEFLLDVGQLAGAFVGTQESGLVVIKSTVGLVKSHGHLLDGLLVLSDVGVQGSDGLVSVGEVLVEVSNFDLEVLLDLEDVSLNLLLVLELHAELLDLSEEVLASLVSFLISVSKLSLVGVADVGDLEGQLGVLALSGAHEDLKLVHLLTELVVLALQLASDLLQFVAVSASLKLRVQVTDVSFEFLAVAGKVLDGDGVLLAARLVVEVLSLEEEDG